MRFVISAEFTGLLSLRRRREDGLQRVCRRHDVAPAVHGRPFDPLRVRAGGAARPHRLHRLIAMRRFCRQRDVAPAGHGRGGTDGGLGRQTARHRVSRIFSNLVRQTFHDKTFFEIFQAAEISHFKRPTFVASGRDLFHMFKGHVRSSRLRNVSVSRSQSHKICVTTLVSSHETHCFWTTVVLFLVKRPSRKGHVGHKIFQVQ